MTRHAEQRTQERSGAVLEPVDVRCRAATPSLFGLPLQNAAKAVLRDVFSSGRQRGHVEGAVRRVLQVASALPSRVRPVLVGVV